jgi:hypothetical protein
VKYLFDNRNKIPVFGQKARDTINNKWNAKNAAKELIRFCRELESGKEPAMAAEGPMSPAPVLTPPGFMRTLQEKNHLE